MSATSPAVSVFFSYAGDDYKEHKDWIEMFRQLLQEKLTARLRDTARLETIHSYMTNGAVAGDLPTELRSRISASAAMVVFVHRHYLKSAACRLELESFCQRFGSEGMNSRLFLIAMSRAAMKDLGETHHWRQWAARSREPIWMNFFEPESDDDPIAIYSETLVGKQMVQSPSFTDSLRRLIKGMDPCFKVSSATKPGVSPGTRRWLIGAHVEELSDEVQRIGALLRNQINAEVEVLGSTALMNDELEQFGAADELLLPFNEGAPLMSRFAAAGHLELQAKAWLEAGKGVDSLHWLDLRSVAPVRLASPAQLEALDRLAQPPVTLDELIGRRKDQGNSAIIYVESNPNELDHWVGLGAELRPHWQQIAVGDHPPQLEIRPRGLPMHKLALVTDRTLSEGDGFILLWGKKETESLLAQVSKVESRLGGSDLPPGIVAYLVPPNPNTEDAVPAYGWRVLRFNAPNDEKVDVMIDDSERLRRFLRSVYERVKRRRISELSSS